MSVRFRSCTVVLGAALAFAFVVGSSASGEAADGADPATKTIVSGVVIDYMRQPAAGVRVGYKTPEDVRADAEAYMLEPRGPAGVRVGETMSPDERRRRVEDMSRLEPRRTYEGGTVVGQTDESGAFRIELPGGGTYVITVELNKANGSQQPVVIETGQALELARPIRLNRGPPSVPGCCIAPRLPTPRDAARAP